jgi:hypothetical protein
VLGELVGGGRDFAVGVVPKAGPGGRSPLQPLTEAPYAGLAHAGPEATRATEVILVDGPLTRVELDEPSGRAGTLTGPWRVADPDGRTVRGGNGLTATITWRCPPGPLAP